MRRLKNHGWFSWTALMLFEAIVPGTEIAHWQDATTRKDKIMSENDTLNWFVSQEAGFYTAQCLNFDIAVQATTLSKLRDAINHALLSEVAIAQEHDRVPFDGIKSAPSKFWKQFAKADSLGDPFEIDWEVCDKPLIEKIAPHFALLKAA